MENSVTMVVITDATNTYKYSFKNREAYEIARKLDNIFDAKVDKKTHNDVDYGNENEVQKFFRTIYKKFVVIANPSAFNFGYSSHSGTIYNGIQLDSQLYADYLNTCNKHPTIILDEMLVKGELVNTQFTNSYTITRHSNDIEEDILINVSRSIAIDFMYRHGLSFEMRNIMNKDNSIRDKKIVATVPKSNGAYYTIFNNEHGRECISFSTPPDDAEYVKKLNFVEHSVMAEDHYQRFHPVEHYTGDAYNIEGRWVVNAHSNAYDKIVSVNNGKVGDDEIDIYVDAYYTIPSYTDVK
jgi:hypothetical protein